jgi:CRP/FNR family transcriptional regulator, cyclic AMP receptor protein
MDSTLPTAFQRFNGGRGEQLIVEALKDQKIILGNADAAEELRSRGRLAYFDAGEFVVNEDAWDNDIIFLISGRVAISITGFKVAERHAGQHIGELALIDPSQPRAASGVAMEPTVCLVVSEQDFSAVASHFPDMWRQIAKEIADRLRQRRKFIRPSNPVPFVFIACASESLDVAHEFAKHLVADLEVVPEVWTDNVFKPSKGTMESLEAKLVTSDFAIAVFSGDDKVNSRGQEKFAPRDNTVFELGLFAGAIGRERSFFAVEKGADLKVPSDLAGVTSLRFGFTEGEARTPDVSDACAQIGERIRTLGPR